MRRRRERGSSESGIVFRTMGTRLKLQCGISSTEYNSGHCPNTRFSHSCPETIHSSLCARYAALAPTGPLSQRFLTHQSTVLQVGSNVFVHGGLLPQHVEYGLERINRETSAWISRPLPDPQINDARATEPWFLSGRNGVVWTRNYSERNPKKCDCEVLEQVLASIDGAERIVMGHTIQNGINSTCEGRAMRIDVGMSQGCWDGEPEVLEILNDKQFTRLTKANGEGLKRSKVEEAQPRV